MVLVDTHWIPRISCVGYLDGIYEGVPMKWMIFLLLFVPLVSASGDNEYTIEKDHKFVNGVLELPVLHTFNFTVEDSFAGKYELIIDYRLEILVRHNENGFRVFGLFLDGVELENCRFISETIDGGTLSTIVIMSPNVLGCMTNEFDVGKTFTLTIEQVDSGGTFGSVQSWNSDISIRTKEDTSMTTFTTVIGLTALEFLTIMGLFIAFWWIFYTTQDVYMMLFSSLLMEIISFVWLWMYIESWLFFHLMMVFVTFFIGAYLFLRTVIQEMLLKVKL
jgi:hypothetical protein